MTQRIVVNTNQQRALLVDDVRVDLHFAQGHIVRLPNGEWQSLTSDTCDQGHCPFLRVLALDLREGKIT